MFQIESTVKASMLDLKKIVESAPFFALPNWSFENGSEFATPKENRNRISATIVVEEHYLVFC